MKQNIYLEGVRFYRKGHRKARNVKSLLRGIKRAIYGDGR